MVAVQKYLTTLVLAIGVGLTAAQPDILGNIASNAFQPIQSAASGILDSIGGNIASNIGSNIGSNLVSAADQAGNFVASAASNAASAVNSVQDNQIGAELSSFQGSSTTVSPGYAVEMCVAGTAVLFLLSTRI